MVAAIIIKTEAGKVHVREIPHVPTVGETFDCCGTPYVVLKVESYFANFFDYHIKVTV
jgi:hypothetical protein